MKKLIYSLPLLLALGACSNEEVVTPDPTPAVGDGYYLSLTASLADASVTKGTTNQDGGSEDGEVAGVQNENTITTAKIYFVGNSNVKTYTATVTAGTANNNYDNVYTLKTPAIDLIELQSNFFGKTLKVYIVANSTVGVTLADDTDPTSTTFTASAAGINAIKNFGSDGNGQNMTFINYKELTVDLSKVNSLQDFIDVSTADDSGYTMNVSENTINSSKYTQAGALDLERAVARIDYADIREEKTAEDVFPLTGEVNSRHLKLYSMQVFNVNPSSYLFKHAVKGNKTTAFSETTPTWLICGVENGYASGDDYNWIGNPDWDLGTKTKSQSNYINKLTTSNKTYAITTTNATGTDDEKGIIKLSDLKDEKKKKGGVYYCWGYITENTVPTTTMMTTNPENNLTGVAFTFQVCSDANGTAVAKTSDGKLTLTMSDGQNQELTYDDTNNGYFLTYYGFIEHNAGEGNAMRYGIVRNNVYQLSIQSISSLPNPSDAKSMYLQLTVNVKKWIKRANSFNF